MVSINSTIGNVAKYDGEGCILGKSACYFNVVENIVSPLYVCINEIQQENLRLSVLRDTILPKLMSGELKISE